MAQKDDDIWSVAIEVLCETGEVTVKDLDADDPDKAREALKEMENRGWLVRPDKSSSTWIPGDLALDHLELWDGAEFVIGE